MAAPALGVAAAAAAAYRGAQALAGAVGEISSPSGPSFGEALRRAAEQAVQTGRAADAASNAALLGQGSVTEVTLAVGRAELALQTATAVRDRVVAAYQEMMRMPI